MLQLVDAAQTASPGVAAATARIAQARAGRCVDFDVVQARMRAKYGIPSR